MNAPGSEASLRDLEAAPLAEQHVRHRHAHVLELDLRMSVRGIVIAKDRQHPLDRDAGRLERDEDHRLTLVSPGVRVALTHEDGDPAAGITGARDPPFASVDDVVIAVPQNLRSN